MNTNNVIIDTHTAQSTSTSASTLLPNIGELLGRVFLASLFLLSGLGKLSAYDQTAGYMSAFGVPSILLPLVIGFEILSPVAIIIGWNVRAISLLLAGFSFFSALVFHTNFADQIQMIMFLKNMSIAGGFLLLVVNGAGAFSLDAWKKNHR